MLISNLPSAPFEIALKAPSDKSTCVDFSHEGQRSSTVAVMVLPVLELLKEILSPHLAPF
jgi:hypothetical protein